MDLIPWRAACAILPRNALSVLALALAALPLLTSGAFADLPNQGAIDAAIRQLEQAQEEASSNVPDDARVKSAEDARDRAHRASQAAQQSVEAAEQAEAAAQQNARRADTKDNQKRASDATANVTRKRGEQVKAAEAVAEAEREAARARSAVDEAQQERAARYRAALDKRRDARQKLQALEAELRGWVGPRRAQADSKDIEVELGKVRRRIRDAEQTVPPKSVAALLRRLSMTANVSTDAQAFCTYGQATPLSVALQPSDPEGNPLPSSVDPALMRTLALLLAPDPLAPINIGNPDGAPPQGQAPENTPKEAPPAKAAAPGPASTAKPPAQPAASASPNPSTQPKPPEQIGLTEYKLRNGEAIVDAIERLAKVADEALARGDMGTFEAYRDAAVTLADRLEDHIYHKGMDDIERLEEKQPLSEGTFNAMFDSTMVSKMAWRDYSRALSEWNAAPAAAAPAAAAPATTPGAATEASRATPAQIGGGEAKPAAPPAARPEPAATPPRTAAPGEKSAPAPEKSASGEKPGIGANVAALGTIPASVAPPADNTIRITIHFKVTEAALQGAPQDTELKAQVAKLTAPEPELPKAGRTRTAKAALDRGHDRGPVTCVAGAGGKCKAQLTAEDLKTYQLLQDSLRVAGGSEPAENFAMELPVRKSTGVVIRKSAAGLTPAQRAMLADAPEGVKVTRADFKVGDKTYTRVGFDGPEAATAKATKKYQDGFGPDVQIDFCIDKQPGPPLGMEPVSFSALNRELPRADVSLGGARSPRVGAPR